MTYCRYSLSTCEPLGYSSHGWCFCVARRNLFTQLLRTGWIPSLVDLRICQSFCSLFFLETTKNRKVELSTEMLDLFKSLKLKTISPLILALPDFEAASVVKIDTSSAAMRALVPRKTSDGNLYLSSRTMHLEEMSYTTCRQKEPTVYFALRKSKFYSLSSEPSKQITDHQVLHYAFDKKMFTVGWIDLGEIRVRNQVKNWFGT